MSVDVAAEGVSIAVVVVGVKQPSTLSSSPSLSDGKDVASMGLNIGAPSQQTSAFNQAVCWGTQCQNSHTCG